MTEAERFLMKHAPRQEPTPASASPANQFIQRTNLPKAENATRTTSFGSSTASGSGAGRKVLAVIVFVPIFLVATYFAKGGGGSPLLGFIIGAVAFAVAGMIWRSR